MITLGFKKRHSPSCDAIEYFLPNKSKFKNQVL